MALAWAKDWSIFRGEQKDNDLIAEFNSLYSEQERRDIFATVTAMDFSNRCMNTLTGQYLKTDAASCDLGGPGEIDAAKKVRN